MGESTGISTSRTNAEFRHIRERQPGRVCLLLIPSILIFSQFSDIGDSPYEGLHFYCARPHPLFSSLLSLLGLVV
jgi:hypothetical protein